MQKLTEISERELIHSRNIELKCYMRSENLFDIEAHIHDSKPFTTYSHSIGTRDPGLAIHDMWLRVTINRELIIQSAEAVMPTGAHFSCVPATEIYSELKGIKIGPGWLKVAKSKLISSKACTHITELLQQIGTTAYQGIWGLNLRKEEIATKQNISFSSKLLDTCFGFRKGGELDNRRKKIMRSGEKK